MSNTSEAYLPAVSLMIRYTIETQAMLSTIDMSWSLSPGYLLMPTVPAPPHPPVPSSPLPQYFSGNIHRQSYRQHSPLPGCLLLVSEGLHQDLPAKTKVGHHYLVWSGAAVAVARRPVTTLAM